jgi:hypothetical protein
LNYYVIWPDGQKFGPADEATLAQWSREGRVDVATELEEADTGRRLRIGDLDVLQQGWEEPAPLPREPDKNEHEVQEAVASDRPVGDTQFEIPQEYPLTSGSPYPVESYYTRGSNRVSNLWGFTIGGLVCTTLGTCCCAMVAIPTGIALTSIGIYQADRALKSGEPNARGPKTFGIVALVIEVLFVIAYAVFYIMMFASFYPGRGGRQFP